MADNRISVDIPEQLVQDILQRINEIKALLPAGLVTLTPEERQLYAKMGDKTVAFVEKSIEYIKLNPSLVPAYVDAAELTKDFDTAQRLRTVYRALTETYVKLDDSMLLAGSEALTASLSFYNSAKDAAKRNITGAKSIADDLSQRFPGRKAKATEKDTIPK